MFPGVEDVHALGGIGAMELLDMSCLLHWFGHLEHDFFDGGVYARGSLVSLPFIC